MFDLVQSQYKKIYDVFKGYEQFMGEGFEAKIKRAISVLHFKYLFGACKEAVAVLPKIDPKSLNLFDLIMSIYNKRRRAHQAKFFLLHCFENALRSTLCVKFSEFYNQDTDDWFLKTNEPKLRKIFKIVKSGAEAEMEIYKISAHLAYSINFT
ncbi:MAG: hypothetical protein ACTTH5_04820 [Wolinella sp.]